MDPNTSDQPVRIFEYRPSRTLLPNEHLRAIVELLRPAGPDLARRWLSALALVPENEREQVVRSVEKRIVELFHPDAAAGSPDEFAAIVGECWAEATRSHRPSRRVRGRAAVPPGDTAGAQP